MDEYSRNLTLAGAAKARPTTHTRQQAAIFEISAIMVVILCVLRMITIEINLSEVKGIFSALGSTIEKHAGHGRTGQTLTWSERLRPFYWNHKGVTSPSHRRSRRRRPPPRHYNDNDDNNNRRTNLVSVVRYNAVGYRKAYRPLPKSSSKRVFLALYHYYHYDYCYYN